MAWLRAHEADLVVNPGILRMAKGRKRAALERWFEGGVVRLPCLDWDLETGMRWAELLSELRRAMPIKESLSAATALVHRLTVATRDRGHFAHAGVRMVDPFGD